MKLKESLALAIGAWLLWSWSAKAEREAEITAVLYSFNGILWLPLQGATIDNKNVIIGVQWKSITATMTAAVRLTISSEFFEEAISIAPGDTGRLDFPITLEDGSYAATVEFLVSNNRRVLDSRTVSFTVATEAPPPPPPGAEFVISGLVVTPKQLLLGEFVSVTATVDNTGGEGGTCQLSLSAPNYSPSEQSKFIAAGGQTTFTWSWTTTYLGYNWAKVTGPTNALGDSFTVEAAGPPPPPPTPAAFQLSDLLTIPNPVELGRLVSARVTVTNNGTAAGSYEFTLIRPAPLTAVVWSGSLAVGGSRLHSVAWNAGIQEGIGTHTISIDGLTASYTVYEEAPPPITGEITSIDAPLEATVAVPITVTVYWKNTSAVSIVGAVKLTVGSSTFTSPDAVVAPGGTQDVPFTLTFAEQGQHTITAQLLGE